MREEPTAGLPRNPDKCSSGRVKILKIVLQLLFSARWAIAYYAMLAPERERAGLS
jgi:hypothetical protein